MHQSHARLDSGRDAGLALAIEAGQVVCPTRGILDVEACFACRRFLGYGEGGRHLRCARRSDTRGLSIVDLVLGGGR